MSISAAAVFNEINYQKIMSDLQSHLSSSKKPAPVNKKLSESRLKISTVESFPTIIEAIITLKEAIQGTIRTFIVKDQTQCVKCLNDKPVNRLQCPECKGLGFQHVDRQVEITLSAGLISGDEIRHPGLGANNIRSGKNGDLVIQIKLNEHPYLKVEGKNITYTMPVSLYEAILGAEVSVPTATGKVVMNLKPLTQAGCIYKLKGLGIAGGDQLVSIDVAMPQALNQEQIQLFRHLAQIAGETSLPGKTD